MDGNCWNFFEFKTFDTVKIRPLMDGNMKPVPMKPVTMVKIRPLMDGNYENEDFEGYEEGC